MVRHNGMFGLTLAAALIAAVPVAFAQSDQPAEVATTANDSPQPLPPHAAPVTAVSEAPYPSMRDSYAPPAQQPVQQAMQQAAQPPEAARTAYPSIRDDAAIPAPQPVQSAAAPAQKGVPGLQPAYPSINEDIRPQDLALNSTASTKGIPGYRLDAGDKVRVTVYGEDDLSGEFAVDGSGMLALPLIGQVPAAGRSLPDLEVSIANKLRDGYLNDPKVSAQITAYRPFFIIGEVNKPGEYPFQSAMNVVTAVALAGGYTYRADESDVYVRRSGSTVEKELPADATTVINPGDTIRVTERFF